MRFVEANIPGISFKVSLRTVVSINFTLLLLKQTCLPYNELIFTYQYWLHGIFIQ